MTTPALSSLYLHGKVIADAVSSVGPPVSMDKMLYLSERMFYQEGTTDAGYLDQCARLRNQLGGMSQVRRAQTAGRRVGHEACATSNRYSWVFWAGFAVDLDLA